MIVKKLVVLFYLLIISVPVAATESSTNKVIRLAASTSVENSGLLKYLLPKFRDKHSYEIKLHIVGSGKALRLGRTGDVDLVWVHSPLSEKKFVSEGYGNKRYTVMRNNFILAGPANDPDKLAASEDIYTALRLIARKKLTFVSRADDSGTNKKELALWKKAKLEPYGNRWYLESGSGMAASLKIAQEENGYILIDRATFLVRKGANFKVLLQDPANLENPYSVIGVNAKKHPRVNHGGASALISWLVSPEGQQAIAGYKHNNVQLFSTTDKP